MVLAMAVEEEEKPRERRVKKAFSRDIWCLAVALSCFCLPLALLRNENIVGEF